MRQKLTRYFTTKIPHIPVTEEEIYRGILKVTETKDSCYWFKRHIRDLADHTKDKMARRFMDISGEVDMEALNFLNKLK